MRSISCLAGEPDSYFELTSSNLGSCHVCEWVDVFTERGEYVGSTQGRVEYTSFHFKKIRLKDIQRVERATSISSIDISSMKGKENE